MKNEQRLKVETVEGVLSGRIEDDIFVFSGIPYAAPPVGPLRWRAPQPVLRWQEPRDACGWGKASWQNRTECIAYGGGDPGELDEDCLYLHVWTPDLQPAKPLPVMVWIHGGGYRLGCGSLPPYHGAALAARGVVMVTLNYRLGHLGFFAHPALDAEYAPGEAINNFALLDQIAALQWVQRNIHAFGGDRHNVTIVGESCGGHSVLALFTSPLSVGLFHKGIIQSVYGLPDQPRSAALANGVAVARQFSLPDATAEQLRALPADAFWPLARELGNGPVAIAGDRVLPQSPLVVFNAAQQHRYPLIIGSNSDEASVLEHFGLDTGKAVMQMRQKHKPGFYLMKLLYPRQHDRLLGRQVVRDVVFTTMGYVVARAQHRAGAPCWRYYFDYVSEHSRDRYCYGVWHGNEVPYFLDTLSDMAPADSERPYSEGDRQFALRVSEYWLRFAHEANLASHYIEGEVRWPRWQPGRDRTLRFGLAGQAHIVLVRRFMKRRMQLFRLLMHRLVRLS